MYVSDLPPLERISHYLNFAEDARREAERAKGSARTSYLLIADHWERLATEAAKEANRVRQSV